MLNTAYAAAAGGGDADEILRAARADGGGFLVSENTRDFNPGRNVYGWRFVTA
jgi:hypothetical protein